MIIYKSSMSRAKRLDLLSSVIKTANSYPGSIANKRVKELINKILDEYPDPLYRKKGVTLIENKGKVYAIKLK